MAKTVWYPQAISQPVLKEQAKLKLTGFAIERSAKQILSGRRTGRTYYVPGTKGVKYIASAPGEAPARPTGRLATSISTAWTGGVTAHNIDTPIGGAGDEVKNPGGNVSVFKSIFKVVVGTNVPAGAWLELGTSRISPRPFLRPAFEKNKHRIGR